VYFTLIELLVSSNAQGKGAILKKLKKKKKKKKKKKIRE
jgi:hypothetical protein